MNFQKSNKNQGKLQVNRNTLKIFSDKSYLPNATWHTPILYPFWGEKSQDPRDPSYGLFNKYINIGQSLFEMTSLKDADFAVLPFDWSYTLHNKKTRDIAKQFVNMVKDEGKKTIIFFGNDSDEEIPIDNVIIFRPSFYKSTRKPEEYAMAGLIEDYTQYTGGNIQIRTKGSKPVIGFCGSADSKEETSLKWRLKSILLRTLQLTFDYRRIMNSGTIIRAKALDILSNNTLIKTKFIIRSKFWGGAISPTKGIDYELMQKKRSEYVKNMVETDYTLCCRGFGNWSARFYETLSCGRIPVFIDTDCVLPYDFLIDYSKYFVWVDQTDIDQIVEKVTEFHKALSEEEFILLQRSCRKLWEDYLSPEGFFINFHRHFES